MSRHNLPMRTARSEILAAANKGANRAFTGSSYRMRHIQEAVFRCRQFQLVKPQVLEAAGFNPKRTRG